RARPPGPRTPHAGGPSDRDRARRGRQGRKVGTWGKVMDALRPRQILERRRARGQPADDVVGEEAMTRGDTVAGATALQATGLRGVIERPAVAREHLRPDGVVVIPGAQALAEAQGE